MNDIQLLEKIRKGATNDYAQIIERYQLKLQSTLSFYCQNRQEVEYFLHEAFTHAYTKLHKFDTNYPFFPWLKRLALNLVRDEFRSQSRRNDRVACYLTEQINNESSNDYHEGKLEHLQNCISELDKVPACLIRLFYWEKKNISELAKLMERKPSAIKMQLMRLRESLKLCIKGKLEAPNG